MNGCRHRGGRIADGHGCAEGRTLRCPFHSWSYSVDGRLVVIPGAEDAFAELDRSSFGLIERPCAEHAGVILALPRGEGPIDAAAILQGVDADLDALGISTFHHFETRTSEWRCNWKLALDTFLESYHVFSLHRESVHPWYFSHPMIYDDLGSNLRFPVRSSSRSPAARTSRCRSALRACSTWARFPRWSSGATRSPPSTSNARSTSSPLVRTETRL